MDKTTKKWCYKLGDVPPDDHFAIIVFSSTLIPGDERSERYPGHGYPAYSQPTVEYISYTDEQEWKNDVVERTTSGSLSFCAIRVKRAQVSINVDVAVD